jgi:hypothetical protein
MPIILGYGEDSLTLHALAFGLADILHQLGDDSDPAQSVVFFRPSFGRKGPGANGSASAQFGEFDAIIGSRKAVYLGEAKWKFAGDEHVLDEKQLRRHRVFRAYLEEHRRQSSNNCNWVEFEARMKPLLQREHLSPAHMGRGLARNLAYILRHLDGCGREIVDVLMFWRLSNADKLPLTCGTFRVITHLCAREEDSDFVRLPDSANAWGGRWAHPREVRASRRPSLKASRFSGKNRCSYIVLLSSRFRWQFKAGGIYWERFCCPQGGHIMRLRIKVPFAGSLLALSLFGVASAIAADLTVSKETFGCEDWDVYVKLFKFLVVDKDNEAFARKLDGVEAECVRLRGDPNCYWMATKFSHISPWWSVIGCGGGPDFKRADLGIA